MAAHPGELYLFDQSPHKGVGKAKRTKVAAEAGGPVKVDAGAGNAQWISSPDVDGTKPNDGIWKITTSPDDWVLF